MKNVILTAISLLILNACAQEPGTAVASLAGVIGGEFQTPLTEVEKNAVVFTGSDFFGQSCTLALSMVVQNGEHKFLTKVGYTIHGTSLKSVTTNAFRFDISSNTFSDATTGTGAVALAGGLLKSEADMDPNLLVNYETTGDLIYYLRVDMNASDAEMYEEAVEEVIEDPTQLAAFSSTLDQVRNLVFKIAHNGHYDAGSCIGFRLSKVEKVKFDLVIDEDDDHDHDHD